MSDQYTPVTTNSVNTGTRLPFFAATGRPSPFCLEDLNNIIQAINRLQNLQVNIQPAPLDSQGNPLVGGDLAVADLNDYLNLHLAAAAAGGAAGTANLVLCQVTTEFTEYLACQPQQATGDGLYVSTGGPAINVAKPPHLRSLASGGSIWPPYVLSGAGAIILAIQGPTGGTGVFVAGADVGYEDANVDARGFSRAILCEVTAEYTEYITCQPVQATAEATYVSTGAPAINVAKPFILRSNPGGGTAIDAVYTSALIYAMAAPTGGTGVFVAGADVGYEDANVDARRWTAAPAGNMNWRGHWSISTAYAVNDVVYTTDTDDSSYSGKYICAVANTGSMPTMADLVMSTGVGGAGTNSSSDWILLALNPRTADYDNADCSGTVHRIVNASIEKSGA